MFPSSIVLGYHGCEKSIGEAILAGGDVGRSENAYDWLGHGAYFWEGSARRAREWAEFLAKHPPAPERKIRQPFVIGAVINLGNALDLADAASLEIVRAGYNELRVMMEKAGAPLPTNEPAHPNDIDLVKRGLDCAVVNFVHALREREGAEAFDTVRGIFTEGGALYPGARILAKTHVQVCVRRPEKSIRGYFRIRPDAN